MLILGHDDVLAALSPEECADAMTAVLAAHARGEAKMPLRSMVPFEGAAGFMATMPAWRGGSDPVFSLKSLVIAPGNPARGLDTHQGTVTLFDGSTGQPRAILDASAVTAVRTAAVSVVATRTLAREDARVLTILGAGVQGRAHLRALPAVRAFDEVRVYSPSVEHARALADGRAQVADSAEAAVRGADVVVLATTSSEPVISRDWLAPGAHVNAIGASVPSARELDTETVAAAALFCDSRESLRNEAGEFRLAVEQGAIAGEDHVRAELGEVLAGMSPGRTGPEELTVFRSLGLAVEDLAAAERAVSLARARGIGVEVTL
ncbi:MAG TPA: ornithine cyclodeaminase family protein [Solirubrobacteraceae bacterium]|nr:ornithine cyclodeaminase family protein [Solirubrobacteraceae bacterium]